MLRNVLKFSGIGVGIVILGLGALYGTQYLRYRTSPEYRAMKYLEDLHRQAVEDPYGGDTPEETLRLFIDALKKGDMDLASKYFTIDEQEREQKDLTEAKNSNQLTEAIKRLQQLKLSKLEENSASFKILDENGILKYQAYLIKNQGGKWKISDL